jgi:hypothetical protein
MIDPVDRAVRAVPRRHSSALVWLQFGIAHLVLLAGVGLLSLYEPISTRQFWVLITEDTRRRLRTEGFEFDERKAVELKGKQVAVQLWAPRASPADASSHDRAGVSLAE